MVNIMTYNQRYVMLCQYFERLLNEIEIDEVWWRNKATLGLISSADLLVKLLELEIRKKTLEEVSKNVLQCISEDIP